MYIFFFFVFLVIPAIIGVAEMLHSLKMAMLLPKDDCRNFSCVFLQEENAVIQLKLFSEEVKWSGSKKTKENFAVYEKLSPKVLEECILLANENDFRIVDLEEFNRIIKEV